MWEASQPLLCPDSSRNPSEHNSQPVENIHCHLNAQETLTYSAQSQLCCCPDISTLSKKREQVYTFRGTVTGVVPAKVQRLYP